MLAENAVITSQALQLIVTDAAKERIVVDGADQRIIAIATGQRDGTSSEAEGIKLVVAYAASDVVSFDTINRVVVAPMVSKVFSIVTSPLKTSKMTSKPSPPSN